VRPVKTVPRTPSRRERARQTRERIVDAAYRLFRERGYEPTTMQDIANEVGVAVQTVYFAFGNKQLLLAAVEPRAVAGDESSSLRHQEWFAQMEGASDPKMLISIFVREAAATIARIAGFVSMVGTSLPMDPAALVQRDRGRDEFFRTLVDRLQALGAIRPGLTAARALDIIRAVVTIDGYRDLTAHGWSHEEWVDWMGELLAAELTGSRSAP